MASASEQRAHSRAQHVRRRRLLPLLPLPLPLPLPPLPLRVLCVGFPFCFWKGKDESESQIKKKPKEKSERGRSGRVVEFPRSKSRRGREGSNPACGVRLDEVKLLPFYTLPKKLVVLKMRSKTNGTIQKAGKVNHVQGDGPNWVLIAGGVLLSTLSVRIGCKLKQVFDIKRQNSTCKAKRRPGTCELHSNLYRFGDQNSCYYCISGIADGGVEVKQAPAIPVSKAVEPSLPLVKIPGPESSKENGGVMWTSSPDRLEPPRKPFQYSSSSGSPCVSESGSDIYSKREVIQKLRQQLKRRDEMIMEMQAQITDLKNSLTIQVTQSTNLQSQLDAANRDLFESEREIQRLRKIIADHCVAEALSHDKPMQTGHWQLDAINGHANGYADSSVDDLTLEKRKGDVERVEMLKREVGELKEVIEGKEFLLQSYKQQKVELCSKIRELQEKLSAQVPNIL